MFFGIDGERNQRIFDQIQRDSDRLISSLRREKSKFFDLTEKNSSSEFFSNFFRSLDQIESSLVKLIEKSISKAATIEQLVETVEIFLRFNRRTVRFD